MNINEKEYEKMGTTKLIIEIGGEEASQLVDILLQLSMEVGGEFYHRTKGQGKLPTMPINVAAVRGDFPGWREMKADMKEKAKDTDLVDRSMDHMKDVMKSGAVDIRFSSDERKVKPKKSKGAKEDSGDSFGNAVNSLFD